MIDAERLGNKHKWKKLSEDYAAHLHKEYREALPEWVKIEGENIPLYSAQGILLANSYTRVVVGDYGAYIEIAPEAINFEALRVAHGQEWRADPKYSYCKYLWLCLSGDTSIKVYYQKAEVSYADYRVGMYYVAPDLINI